jgi:hypothetical protein
MGGLSFEKLRHLVRGATQSVAAQIRDDGEESATTAIVWPT